MTDITPHIVITEVDEREHQMEDLKKTLSEEGAIRDGRETEMAELKKELSVEEVVDTREERMAELRKALRGHTETREQRMAELKKQLDSYVGSRDGHIRNVYVANNSEIKNIKVSPYQAKPFANAITEEDCDTIHDYSDLKECRQYCPGVAVEEGTHGRKMYSITEAGVTLKCMVYKISTRYMVSINNVVMPLREFIAVRHMKVKESCGIDAELLGMRGTIICDTTTSDKPQTILCDTEDCEDCDHTMLMPRSTRFEIKGASIETLTLAQIVLESFLRDQGEC